ncbi:MAG: aspartate kinase [Candidatus Omnitrophica bacterium]|nr:aspartate kinase [Candidatus Omnitrophota bacterium]MBU2043747.1 aspartate kinase [Candidatus Omnitrophota bacterium]MBU2251334.1 aspartate kinase [Candidatus Omnitrophota bacterium]MBU2265648.1 aspartate kinase [Candidatus Omnitrophota bacterium]MBU2473698.1 aspartate kinase [Candidatus Omnitrophota bacterium]
MAKSKLIVQKYGGSSVANAVRIEKVAQRIISCAKRGNRVVVVVSAMGDTTDDLISLARQINSHPSEREMDMLMSTGEQISCSLLAMAIDKRKVPAISFTGPQVGIITDTYHTQAKILKIETERIKKELTRGKIVIVAGFQGLSTALEITTLGRGGSDLSAVAMAVALGADLCEIYTDVEGIYTADPRIVKNARKLSYITFDEMLELASRGAQVMHTRAVEVAKKFNIPLSVRSSFSKKEGTIIMENPSLIEEPVVRGVALADNEAKITICNLPDRPGIAARMFKELACKNINIDMIVQNVSHKRNTDISFTVLKKDLAKTLKISRQIATKIGAGVVLCDETIAKVSVVGVGMRSHSGVAARCFSVLAKNKINIEMISTSEISISCVLKKSSGKKALKALHKAFNLGLEK